MIYSHFNGFPKLFKLIMKGIISRISQEITKIINSHPLDMDICTKFGVNIAKR